MKKIIIGLMAMISVSAHADCYWDYANHNLDRKVQNGIFTLGISVLASKVLPSEVEKALELITESIGLQSLDKGQYLRKIQNGNFGSNLEKILIEGRTDRLKKMLGSLKTQGVNTTLEVVAQKILELSQSDALCNKEKEVSSYGSFSRFKTIRQIESMLLTSFMNEKNIECKLIKGDIEELSLSFSPSLDKAYYFNNSENYEVACNKKYGFIICDEKKPVLTIMMPPVGNTLVIERLSDGSRVVNQFKCER